MKRYVSAPVLISAGSGAGPARVDLVFYGVDPSGPSYQARVFVNRPDADENTSTDDESFAGRYTVFGHGGCFGDDEDHCAPPPAAPDPFDLRPPTGIPRQTKAVTVTPALAARLGEPVRFTVVAVVVTDAGQENRDVMRFDEVQVIAYG